LCCALDIRCNDACKSESQFSYQFKYFFSHIVPTIWLKDSYSKFWKFVGLFSLSAVFIGIFLLLFGALIQQEIPIDKAVLIDVVGKSSFVFIIASGVICWIFVLSRDSQRLAQEEIHHQTSLLEEEIAAHTETDKALQEAKDIAESANHAKSRYLTGISHELRSPLNAILGYAQLLEKDSTLDSDIRRPVEVMKRSAEYLSDLIEGLLEISKIEAGRLDIIRREVPFPQFLDQIIDMFEPQIKAKGIGFSYDFEGRIPALVLTDEKRLRQILINLLSNAIKYTEKGHVSFSVRYRNEIATFKIRDSGRGIAEKDIEDIFKPFVRINNDRVAYVAGTGLGLTICKLLVDIMGGEIVVNSKLNEGSEFIVSLMLSRVTNPNMRPLETKSISGYLGERKTVMVVDDDPNHRALVKDILIPLGFTICESVDGAQCIEKLELLEPDIFLVDVEMPILDGWGLLKTLRDTGIMTPVIMISANAAEGHIDQDFLDIHPELQHSCYLTKPIRIDGLIESVRSCLNLSWTYLNVTELELSDSHDECNYLNHSSYTLSVDDAATLDRMAKAGYKEGVELKLEAIRAADPEAAGFVDELIATINKHGVTGILRYLEVEL
jgi:signal transduction histidine kinase/DNA-binding response OmpR family regulator